MQSSTMPIPVPVLSGYRGTGNTTTLNPVRNTDRALNAANVTEMGEVTVNASLVERESELSQRGENLTELSNGCGYRRFRGDMLAEIGRLADERDFEYPAANE